MLSIVKMSKLIYRCFMLSFRSELSDFKDAKKTHADEVCFNSFAQCFTKVTIKKQQQMAVKCYATPQINRFLEIKHLKFIRFSIVVL